MGRKAAFRIFSSLFLGLTLPFAIFAQAVPNQSFEISYWRSASKLVSFELTLNNSQACAMEKYPKQPQHNKKNIKTEDCLLLQGLISKFSQKGERQSRLASHDDIYEIKHGEKKYWVHYASPNDTVLVGKSEALKAEELFLFTVAKYFYE